MSDQIPVSFSQQYADNVTLLAQQEEARLLMCVNMKKITGKRGSFDQVGSVDMVQRTSRRADTQYVDTPHSRRWANLIPFEVADTIDEEDEVQTAVSLQSSYVKAHGAAAGRRIDQSIINAAYADADDGQEGASQVSFDANNLVAVDFGAAAPVGFSLAKWIRMKKILDSGEVPDRDRYLVIGSSQLNDDLLNDSTLTSSDYNAVKALVKGEVDSFLGFKVIRLELLPTDGSGYRKALAFQKDGIGLLMGIAPKGSVDKLPTKSNTTQLLYKVMLGAVRIEEARVVSALCLEA